jgi:hypothetical protein
VEELAARPKSRFSWDFEVLDGSRVVADIDMTFWRRKGTLTVEGAPFRAYREGLMSGPFLLEDPAGTVVARAEKPNALFRSFDLEHAGRRLNLRAHTAFGRAFVLEEGGRPVGTIAPDRFWTRRTTARLPDDLPLPVRAFILWLVFVLWRREADSGSTAA